MSKKIVLRARDLCKSFLHPIEVGVLKGVNLEIAEGESIAITGASGEGKSTLLQILGTLDAPSTGTLEIAGTLSTARTASLIRNQHIGFVFQSFHLLDDYTVLENVLMPARIARRNTLSGSEVHQHAEALLERVGLSDRRNFNTKLLSGGEKQRVSLARALCNNPDLILADEPTGNLDHHTSEQIHELLFGCVKDEKKSLIVVTHDHELAGLCDRHLILEDGLLHEKQQK